MGHLFCFLGKFDGHKAIISEEEQHHLKRVLKLKIGTKLEVIDGQGRRGVGEIASIEAAETIVALDAPAVYQRSPSFRVELAVGALRHGMFDDLIAPLCELGVTAIHCFHQRGSERSRINDKARHRWQRLVVSAAKQSKSVWLAQVSAHSSIESLLASWDNQDGERIYLDGESHLNLAQLTPASSAVLMVVGGEMGLSQEDIQLLQARGYRAMRISPNVLRSTTAVIAAAAAVAHHMRDAGQ